MSGLEARLEALREQGHILAENRPRGRTSPDTAELAAVADQLEDTIALGDPKPAKAVLAC